MMKIFYYFTLKARLFLRYLNFCPDFSDFFDFNAHIAQYLKN